MLRVDLQVIVNKASYRFLGWCTLGQQKGAYFERIVRYHLFNKTWTVKNSVTQLGRLRLGETSFCIKWHKASFRSKHVMFTSL